MAENETNKKKKVAIITASVVAVVTVLFLAIFLPIYLTQKSSETETVESNLPSGQTLNMLMKQNDDYTAENSTITRIVFDYYDKDESGEYTQTEDGNYTYTENGVNVLEGQTAESYTWNKTQIDLYRISDGDKTTIYFLSTENIIANSSMTYAFYNFSTVEEIVFNNFDTSKVTTMNSMFYYCRNLTKLNLSNFDTSNVTNMYAMFYFCRSLTELDLSNLNTYNVTNMSNMFSNCENLSEINISNFNTSNVTNMGYMFRYCGSLVILDLSSFDTSNVARMQYMFYACTNLETIYVGEGWSTDAVTNDTDMFYRCTSLTNFTTNGSDTTSKYAYAGYNEELEKYGYLTDISEKDAGNLDGDND